LASGVVFNIQRYSLRDGPGIRTTVFLKGCTLRCFWCHNPEGLRLQPEVQFFPQHCINCLACVKACTHGAQTAPEGSHVYLRENCVSCGACVDTCYAGAMVMTGKRMTVDEVMAEVLADRDFYASSGGGMTLSGGEPAMQVEFSYAILARSKAEGIHTAVETAANVPWESLERLLPVTDLIMTDIKHMDSARHKDATGVHNERILENQRRLAQMGKPMILRTPVVPGVNDTPAEIAAIAAYVRSLNELRPAGAEPLHLELLRFHHLADDKYRSLGMDHRAAKLTPPTKEHMAELGEAAKGQGIECQVR
jgi:pyruvate formate lyase activating enzyme